MSLVRDRNSRVPYFLRPLREVGKTQSSPCLSDLDLSCAIVSLGNTLGVTRNAEAFHHQLEARC